MQSKAQTPQEYFDELPEERKPVMNELRAVIKKNIPDGFVETIGYGMVGYIVPHALYAEGYHCDPRLPLPFIGIASQKHFIALYHMGIYANPKLLRWFTSQYPKHTSARLDMGKSCIRFKKPEHVPMKLIGELVTKMTPQDWITIYERVIKAKK